MFGRGIKGYLLDFLKLNIKRGDLVLEIGSGDKPFIRADILMDKFIRDDTERGGRIIADRPFICGDIENLPFKDKSFDYIYCSHIVEHMKTPEKGLEEIRK
ncbi:MAG: methyltransferase domain-containing protein [Nitrospinae bacterium]|nr:methyltransferase domain-containing protein [Nitrospinota bacterium]